MILEQTGKKAPEELKQLRTKVAEIEDEILELQHSLADKAQDQAAQAEMERCVKVQKERGENAEQYGLSSSGEQDEGDEDEGNTGWGAQGMYQQSPSEAMGE